MNFIAHHASGNRNIKGEDALVIKSLNLGLSPSSSIATDKPTLFLICDGHSKARCATFVSQTLPSLLSSMLSEALSSYSLAKGDKGNDASSSKQAIAERIRIVVCDALAMVDDQWMQMKHPTSGTTVTLAILIGDLLTIANIGDSTAILDTGCSILELTCTHRIHDSVAERDRLVKAGCEVAPLGFHLQGPAKNGEKGVGPLRVWPGGLCVGRSIGDADVGPHVVPIPHIRQLRIPDKGCRVILATDGLWDVVPTHKVAVQSRGKLPGEALDDLMQQVEGNNRIIDDTSIIIVDISPLSSDHVAPSGPSASTGGRDSISKRFTPIAWKEGAIDPKPFWGAGSPPTSSGGGCFACFAPEVIEPDSRQAAGDGRLDFFADIDCLKEYPSKTKGLVRSSLVRVHRSKQPSSYVRKPSTASKGGEGPTSHSEQLPPLLVTEQSRELPRMKGDLKAGVPKVDVGIDDDTANNTASERQSSPAT